MNNLNLCEILKGHEGETFYSKALGYVKLHKVFNNSLIILALKHNRIGFEIDVADAIEDIVPSKDQRDWNKWIEKQKLKTPKTWKELIEANQNKSYGVVITTRGCCIADEPIEKSALALLKIHQLIEVGYGGNVKNRDRVNFYTIQWSYECNRFVIRNFGPFLEDSGTATCFHTKEQAIEFLSYPENVQLLKDYFMI